MGDGQLPERLLTRLRWINHGVAVLVGIMFLACVGLVLVDVILRRLGSSLGGTDEIAGYTMAIGTAWGMAYALLELAHVRIDFLRVLMPGRWRAVLDLFSMLLLSGTVSLIAIRCWPVLATTLKNGSKANTPLETPLVLVQVPWFLGWVWFAIMAWLTFAAALVMVLRGEFQKAENRIGVFPEHEVETR